jgi:hypothetical protein
LFNAICQQCISQVMSKPRPIWQSGQSDTMNIGLSTWYNLIAKLRCDEDGASQQSFVLFEQLLCVVPYSEEVFVTAQERAARIWSDIGIHVVIAEPGRGRLRAEGCWLRRLCVFSWFFVRVGIWKHSFYTSALHNSLVTLVSRHGRRLGSGLENREWFQIVPTRAREEIYGYCHHKRNSE